MILIKKMIYLIALFAILAGCVERNADEACFNGEIQIVEDGISEEMAVSLKSLPLDGANYGYMAVYDSLIFFLNPKLPDHFYNIFHVDTGKEIGSFCCKGGGPEESVSLGPIFHFFSENQELKALLFAPYEEKMFIWNITRSIGQNKTVMDKVIPYAWRSENGGACYNVMRYCHQSNTLLTKVDAFPLGEEDATLPFLQKRTLDTNKRLKDYPIYKRSVKNEDLQIIPEAIFASNNAFKPDGTKAVQAMVHLPQLNIVDMESGQVTGYRLKGGEDFSTFYKAGDLKAHYVNVQADDNYIYAAYYGKKNSNRFEIPEVYTIYVFDWSGRLVQKLRVDHPISEIFLDSARNRLYITKPKVDEVYYFDLNEVFNSIKY